MLLNRGQRMKEEEEEKEEEAGLLLPSLMGGVVAAHPASPPPPAGVPEGQRPHGPLPTEHPCLKRSWQMGLSHTKVPVAAPVFSCPQNLAREAPLPAGGPAALPRTFQAP